jgi:hypothetical protein
VKRIRRRILALVLGVVALTPTIGAPPAQASRANLVIYAGSCPLEVTFKFHEPIGVGTLGAPGYDLEVGQYLGLPCVLTDDPIDPLRSTTVSAGGGSNLFNCDAALGFGSWNQSWRKGNGIYSPQPVNGGSHRVYGTWDNWVLETEGPSIVTFAGAAHLRLDPLSAGFTAAACSNGSLWELRMIGTQVFEDPQP